MPTLKRLWDHHPLYVHIATVFTLLVFVAGTVIGWGNYFQGRGVALAGAEEVFERMERESRLETEHLRVPAEAVIDWLSSAPLTEAASLAERLHTLRAMTRVLEKQLHLTAIYIGYDNGDFFLVRALRNDADRALFKAPAGAAYLMQHIEAPNVRLHLHGRRDSQPGFSEALIDSIADPRITFHGAFAPAELGTVLSHLDALVVPSLWYENTPFSVLEALHAGVPVIASDLGGIAEIVREGESGILFPAGKAKRLAEVIQRIAADPETTLAITPPQPPSIADNLVQLQTLYESLIAEAPTRN